MPNDFANLKSCTEEFLVRHWSEEKNGNRPQWSHWDTFPAAPAPNYKLGGCYALAKAGEVIYVGLATSKGGGAYKDSGISRRLMSHVYLTDKVAGSGYILREKWKDVTELYTLGFDREDAYLAPALELFLIRTMSPACNVVGHALSDIA